LRGKGEEAKAKKRELIKSGIEEKYIKDFAEDFEGAEGAICGNEERLSVYLEILDVIS
jgi:hypothetical protein